MRPGLYVCRVHALSRCCLRRWRAPPPRRSAASAAWSKTTTASRSKARPSRPRTRTVAESLTATTDDKGRFAMIGLRSRRLDVHRARRPASSRESGEMQRAGGRDAAPPLTFTLQESGSPAAGRARRSDRERSAGELAAADALFNQQKWDEAISVSRDPGEGAGAERHQPADRRAIASKKGLSTTRRSPPTTSC